MADQVLYQDGDDLTETALAETFARANASNYVERGLGIEGNADYTNDTVDVGGGLAILEEANEAYFLDVDARTDLALPDSSGVNYVYVRHDPTTDDAITVSVESSTTSYADPQLLLGTVDTANQTETNLNRAPSLEAGAVSAGVDDSTPAAQSGAVRLPNGEWVAARDSADGADVNLARLTSSDLLELGPAVAGLVLGDGFGIDVSEDGGAETLADMSVTSSPAAGTEESYALAIDGTALLKLYAEADGAGSIQNAAAKLLGTLDVNSQIINDGTTKLYEPTNGWFRNEAVQGLANLTADEQFSGHPLGSSDLASGSVTRTELASGSVGKTELDYVETLVDSPNGHIPTALLEDTESAEISIPVPSGETLKVYRWGAYKIADGTAPTGLEAQLLDGSDTIQASANTVNSESTDPTTPVASYNNGTTSLSIFKLRAKNSTGNNYTTDGVGGIFGYLVE